MRAASHHTMFPCPWQQYRGRIFTEQLFGDLSDVLSTNMLFFAMGKLYCCTTSIPTCFFSKRVLCQQWRAATGLISASCLWVWLNLFHWEPGDSGEHFSFEQSLNFQSVTFDEQWHECGWSLRAHVTALGVMFLNISPFPGDSSKPLFWRRQEWKQCGFAWMFELSFSIFLVCY